jgi:peptidoglycan/xylan/chitin deacetylase (PgdA/CDA1 family)
MTHSTTVLMYHAVGDTQGLCVGADAHYAVSSGQFARHLAMVKNAGSTVASVARLLAAPHARASSVAFTFDDGHSSNGGAAESIAKAGGSADFFVNPAHVGAPNYLSWSDLRAMAQAGMSIQSHGFNHYYLNDLSPQEVESQLVDSKRAIEDQIGQPVTIFAPPGGRMAPNLKAVAERVGYRAICSSRVGLWAATEGAWDVARLAVMLATPDQQVERWIQQDRWEMANRRARYAALTWAKRLLGNQRYDRLRQQLLGASQ